MNEKLARRLVRERSGGDCEIRVPRVCLGRATNFQHRRAQKHAGLWTPSNGLDVCGMGNVSGCHGYIHQNPNVAVVNGWTVKSWDDWRMKSVQLWSGERWLDDTGRAWSSEPSPPCPLGCAVWTSNNRCDCTEEAS